MFLRKLGKRGAEMVEYAIVLACIAAVGVGFYSSNDSKLTGVLDSLFGNVRQVLGLADSGEATGKHALKGTGIEAAALTALDFQVNIPYDYITEKLNLLGENTQLQAVAFNSNGDLESIWYSKNGELKALDSALVNRYSGKWEKNNDSVQGKYWEAWHANTENDGYKSYCANSVKNAKMFVAYDKYGNVISKVNTSNLRGDEIANVQDKSTVLYMKSNNKITKYDFNDTDGFYVKQTN